MKIWAIAASAALFCVSSQAAEFGFIEGTAGLAIIAPVTTSNYSFDYAGDTYSGHGRIDYGDAFTVGAEAGYAGIYDGRFRLSVSWDYLHANFDKAAFVGTVNGTPGTYEVPASVFTAAGLNLDTTMHLVAGNLDYNLPLLGEWARPYVGVGVGAALIDHAENQLAVSATAGVRFAVTDDVYLGVRYRFWYVNGPRDDFGTQYNAVFLHTVSGTIGLYLN